ncbi:MAG: hypothetical protein IJG15_07115, partial [Lachnospiraceae bacterium]|nr:hypothetical protein [Lachnospiraceae bacterium]
ILTAADHKRGGHTTTPANRIKCSQKKETEWKTHNSKPFHTNSKIYIFMWIRHINDEDIN